MSRNRVIQRVVDQGRLARAGDAGHANKQADRQLQRHALEIVARGAGDGQRPVHVGLVTLGRHRYLPMTGQILSCQRMRRAANFLRRSLRDDLPAVLARPGPHVDDVVG